MDGSGDTRAGAPIARISRDLPLSWLITLAGGLVAQGVTLWTGQQQQATAIKDLAAEVRELRMAINSSSAKTTEHGVRLAEHERRIGALESSRGGNR